MTLSGKFGAFYVLMVCPSFITLRRAESPFVFLSEEEKRRFWLNHVKLLKLPPPKLLDKSILFSIVKMFFFRVRVHLLIDRPMVITKLTIASTSLLDLDSKLYPRNVPCMLNKDLT